MTMVAMTLLALFMVYSRQRIAFSKSNLDIFPIMAVVWTVLVSSWFLHLAFDVESVFFLLCSIVPMSTFIHGVMVCSDDDSATPD